MLLIITACIVYRISHTIQNPTSPDHPQQVPLH